MLNGHGKLHVKVFEDSAFNTAKVEEAFNKWVDNVIQDEFIPVVDHIHVNLTEKDYVITVFYRISIINMEGGKNG